MNFEEIYNKYYSQVYKFVFRMVGCKDETEDILQDVFIKMYNYLGNNNNIINPKAWLLKVAANTSVTKLNKNKLHKKYIQSELINSINKYESADEIEKKEKFKFLNIALNSLSEREKLLIILYQENLSYAEIAKITGINEKSVGKYLSRTIEKLSCKINEKLKYEM